MLEALLAGTNDLIERVEQEADLAITVSPQETWGVSRLYLGDYLSRPDAGEITVGYNPRAPSVDYAIAHEVARLHRIWRAPERERGVLSSNFATRLYAILALQEDIAEMPTGDREGAIHGFEQFYDGLVTQLGSMPADPWLNAWLLNEYPALEPEIATGVAHVFDQAHRVLASPVRRFIPPTIYGAANAMNAAYALHAEELLGQSGYAAPYRATGYARLGLRLRELNEPDRGHVGDRETAQLWARELGLVGWYTVTLLVGKDGG